MGFEKGKPRHVNAGRKKGTPNKRTQLLSVAIENTSKNPFMVLFGLLDDKDKYLRLQAAKELCKYLEPALRAVEHSTGNEFVIKIESDESGL